MATSELKPLLDSTGDVGDPELMRQRMEQEGYLFFHGMIPAERALQVKRDMLAVLREHHLLEDDGNENPLWSGGPEPTEAEYMVVYDQLVRLESLLQLAQSPEIVNVLESVVGEPVNLWEQKLIRIVYPDPQMTAPQGVGAHQDGDPKLAYQTSHFYTGWISLMEINRNIGGLAIAPRSHQQGILHSTGSVASSSSAAARADYGLDATTLPWRSAEFRPGSAILFHCHTPHRGLANHSDRLRLSCDFRYQPASETASWIAHTPGPDVRRVGQQVDAVISSRALYVTTRASADVLGAVRQRMMEEKSTTLARAQELVVQIQGER